MKSGYDYRNREANVTPDASLYEHYHEMAHDVQARLSCRPMQAWVLFNGIRVLGYLATIWVEYDARRRARHALEWIGAWTDDMEKEASTKFRTYITRTELT